MIRKVILSLCLSLGLVMPVWAEEEAAVEENTPAEQVAEVTPQAEPLEQVAEEEPSADVKQASNIAAENIEQGQENVLENAELSLNKEKKPELEIVYQVEKNIQALPSCTDEKLQNGAYEYIQSYFNETPNQGTLFRRHKYFVLNNLNKFAQENVADYKTSATSPVSDIIMYIKMHKNVIEENMRLCKNTSTNEHAGKIFLLIYPEDENNYRVNVINLSKNPMEQLETTFTYAK